jgi:hypothetical protein
MRSIGAESPAGIIAVAGGAPAQQGRPEEEAEVKREEAGES